MKVVGLLGNAGVGKDTVARLHFKPLGYHPIALADDIKIKAISTGVATYEEIYCARKSEDVRVWLQQEGTERGRDVYGEDVWVDALYARMRRFYEEWGIDKFVVTDVRFINEVVKIRESGGLVFRVHAPSRDAASGMGVEHRQHRSESGIGAIGDDLVDGFLLNDPKYKDTVDWQVRALLYLRGFLDRPSVVDDLSRMQKQRLIKRMLSGGGDRDS